MANILLKDKNGANIVYRDIDYLSLSTAEGGTVRFNERTVEVISVTELPTEEINDGAVYKVTTKDENEATIVKFYVHDEESGEWSEIATGAKLSEKAITENGEYVPEGSYDGFSKVTVDIDTFTDVEEFPMENIDQEAIYRVVRQDEETGTTYTTYGIFDADDTKTVLEYNAEEGWVECGAGGANASPVEITANGVYDETTLHDYIGDLEPGARYVYKNKIEKSVLAELFAYAGENGALHQFTREIDDQTVTFVTSIYKIGSEYILASNSSGDAFGSQAGQFYCTSALTHWDLSFEAGWNVLGVKFSDSMDASKPCAVDDTMRIPMIMPNVFDSTTILGAEGLLEFYRDKLLWKKVDMSTAYTISRANSAQVGTVSVMGGTAKLCAANCDMTVDQLREIPTLTLPGSDIGIMEYMYETAYQFVLLCETGAKTFLSMQGAPTEILSQYKLITETDAYFMMLMFDATLVYIKDLNANGAEDLEGTFEEGHWYIQGSLNNFVFYPYCKTTYEAYNPVVVNIPNADTIVEVDELPATVESDKIYKKVDRTAKYNIMAKMDNELVDIVVFLEALGGTEITVVGVDALPETLIPSTAEHAYMYIILTTGEMFESTESGTAEPSSLLGFNTDQFGGTTEDPSYVPEDDNVKYFFLKSYDEFVTYGLPNNGTDKQYYEYNENTSTWEELDSGDMLMERVDELPAENVNDNKVYCVKNEIEAMTDVYITTGDGLAMSLAEFFEMYTGMIPGAVMSRACYVVDELPANPAISTVDQQARIWDFHIYLMSDTGEQWVSLDGTTYVSFGESGFLSGTFMGKISDTSEAEMPAGSATYLYTIMRDYSVSYTYGIPNDGNNKSIMVYRNGTWVRFVEETPAVEPTDPEATT